MIFVTLLLFLYFSNSHCKLWSKGIVHYSINTKDYDPHSQEIIIETLRKIQKEICLKFFSIPVNYTAEVGEKVLYIQNPKRDKICPPQNHDFTKSVIDMPIGYKCINERDISRLVVEMLKASIHKSETIINSYDLMKKFQEKNEESNRVSLLSPHDRNYINAHYFQECGGLSQRSAPSRRLEQDEDVDAEFSPQNRHYYSSKMWPLGIVIYRVNEISRRSADFSALLAAMRTIELETCVMFQEAETDDVLDPKNVIVFGEEGADWPLLGFREGVQELKLSSIVRCQDPGHTSHVLMMLLRILGIPMTSNRFDRDNYLRINWKNVQKGMEMLLEKSPEAAWLKQIPYDFTSVTHAPASFLCPGCLTTYTVEPIQDHLWRRTLTMGRSKKLSAEDVRLVSTVYTDQCQARVLPETPVRVIDEDGSNDDRVINKGGNDHKRPKKGFNSKNKKGGKYREYAGKLNYNDEYRDYFDSRDTMHNAYDGQSDWTIQDFD